MPITSNGFYNDAALGQSFGNIASMFAPPSMNDVAMAQNIRANQAAASLNQQKFAQDQAAAAAKNAAIDRLRKIDPDGADALLSGASDPAKLAAQFHQLQLARAGAPLTGQDPYKLVYSPAGDLVSTQLAHPLGNDTVSYRPAGMAGPTASTAYGPIKTGDRTTLFPNGAPPIAGAAPAGDDDTDTAIKAGLGVGGGSAPAAAASPAPLGSGAAAPSGFDPMTAAITRGLLTGSSAPAAAGVPTLGGGYSQSSAAQAPTVAPSLAQGPAALNPQPRAAAPDNGITYGPGGMIQLTAPDKPDTTDGVMAAYLQAHPDQIPAYLAGKNRPLVDMGGNQLQKNVTGQLDNSYGAATAAAKALPVLDRQEAALNQGIISGAGADLQAKARSIFSTLTGTPDPGLAHTQEFVSAGQANVGNLAKTISNGGHTTNRDIDVARMIEGNDPSYTTQALHEIIRQNRLVQQDIIANHNGMVRQYQQLDPGNANMAGFYLVNPPAAAYPAASPITAANAPGAGGQGQADVPPAPGARRAPDGNWYVADPRNAGKYLMVQ